MRVGKTLVPNHTLKSAIRQIMDKAATFEKRLHDDDVKAEMDKYVWVNNHTHDFVQYMMLYIVATMFIPDTGVQLYCEMKMKEKFDVTSIDPSARKVEFKPVAPLCHYCLDVSLGRPVYSGKSCTCSSKKKDATSGASSSSDNGSKRKREGE